MSTLFTSEEDLY